jgi:hypothetical protein
MFDLFDLCVYLILFVLFILYILFLENEEKNKEIMKQKELENKQKEQQKIIDDALERRNNKNFIGAKIMSDNYYLRYKHTRMGYNFIEQNAEIPMDLYYDDVNSYGSVIDDDVLLLFKYKFFGNFCVSFAVVHKIVKDLKT